MRFSEAVVRRRGAERDEARVKREVVCTIEEKRRAANPKGLHALLSLPIGVSCNVPDRGDSESKCSTVVRSRTAAAAATAVAIFGGFLSNGER
jgi:hypothetical protein